MSRLKQNQNIDRVISDITIIAQSQCSLSVEDLEILNEALQKLQQLKHKKGKTNKQIREEVSRVVELLISFFL
ncbi:MAG: hypothetical protein EOO87_06485 [Pedobacter sp.]|nr:MAG: hypothetical protein EOO87_06485 [Pedobacter sp.]